MSNTCQTNMKRIVVATSAVLLLTAVTAFGLKGWTALASAQQPAYVTCQSGCKVFPELFSSERRIVSRQSI
jgi:hypothetical protein